MKKILVTGVKGQLGSEVIKLLGDEAIAVDAEEIDLSTTDPVPNIYDGIEAVIHCAAYTAVDKAEDNYFLAKAINVGGTKKMAEFARKNNAKFIYISTDYVFDGNKDGMYEIDDIPCPQSVYGQTKLDGENIVRDLIEKYFIVRTSWIFGNGTNFVKTMLRLAGERDTISVVNDQVGSPTYAADLACLLVEMIKTDKYGTYHATNEGFCSWYEFASVILKGKSIKVNPISTAEYLAPITRATSSLSESSKGLDSKRPALAKRPLNSKLSKRSLTAAGFSPLPSWQDALERYLMTI